MKKRVINFCSVRGGPGKSNLVIACGFYLQKRNQKVVLVDFDIPGPLLDVLFGITKPNYTITDYLTSTEDEILLEMKTVSKYVSNVGDLIHAGLHGLDLVVASRDLRTMRKCMHLISNEEVFKKFDEWIEKTLLQNYDYVLIDNAPGILDTSLISNITAELVLYFIRDRLSEFIDLDLYYQELNKVFKSRDIDWKIIVTQSYGQDLKRFQKKLRNINIEKDVLVTIPFYNDLRQNADKEVLFLKNHPNHPIYQKISEIVNYCTGN